MATKRLKKDKSGRPFYLISCKPEGRTGSERSKVWHIPEGWSERAIQRELTRVMAEFEIECRSGEHLTKAERKTVQEAEEQRQKAIDAAHVTLRTYVEEVFMPDKQENVARNTVKHYRNIFDLYILPQLGDLKLTEIRPVQVKQLLLEMQKTHAHATVIHVYTAFSQIFKMACMDDTVDRNIMDKVPRPREKKENKKTGPECYTPEEVARIIECLDSAPLRWRAYTMLLIDTGMRRGEACGLRWEDIDIKKGTVTIRRSLNYNGADTDTERGTFIDATKTGKIRTVDLDPGVLDLLLDFRTEMQQNGILTPWVFPSERGDTKAEPMHPQTPNRWMQRFAKENGIENLHPHKLRHTMASISIEYGADVASVAMKLGHSKISTTLDTYTHSNLSAVKRSGGIFREAIRAAQDTKEKHG